MGYATSHDEVVASLSAVALPLSFRGRARAALAAVYLETRLSAEEIATRLRTAVGAITDGLDG